MSIYHKIYIIIFEGVQCTLTSEMHIILDTAISKFKFNGTDFSLGAKTTSCASRVKRCVRKNGQS